MEVSLFISPVSTQLRTRLLVGVAVLALTACSGARPGLEPSGVAAVPNAALAPFAAAKIGSTPSKLNFTTTPSMKLTVSEKKYTGKFTLSVSPSNLVKLSPSSAKGPSAKITVTASNAGTGSISISDQNGGKAIVPVTVTQGVIIIQ